MILSIRSSRRVSTWEVPGASASGAKPSIMAIPWLLSTRPNNAAIAFAGSQGNFQLNVFKPVIIRNFLHSANLLTDACNSFTAHLLEGLTVNRAQIRKHLDNSLMLVTALSPQIGYDKAAEIAHKALHEGLTLRAACIGLGYLSGEEFDELVKPETMTGER